MATVISILLQKGGSAKTTTAVNLCAFAGLRKHKVLLIDMDGQTDATFVSGGSTDNGENTIREVIAGDCTASDAIQHLKYYDLIPARTDVRELANQLSDQYTLKRAISSIRDDYELIVIDNAPAINAVSINALVASDTMILPIEAKPLSFKAMADLLDTINEIHALHWNDELDVLGVLLIRYNNRSNTNKRMEQLIRDNVSKLNTTVFECSIRECSAISECQEKQMPLPDYRPKGNAYIDYNGFVTRVFERLEEKNKCQ